MMAWGLIMQRVQSEKVAVFFPLNIRPPKKKSISCEEKREKKNQNKREKYMNFAGESCHNINILTLLADSGESEPCAAFFVLSGRKTAGLISNGRSRKLRNREPSQLWLEHNLEKFQN